MTAHATTVSPTTSTSSPCAVRDVSHGVGLFATRDIAAGSAILEISGRVQNTPTRYSIQFADGQHVEADGALPDHEMRTRHPWRFLNHCCDPNARIDGRTLRAIHAIRAGEQITFDYNTTELDMAEPFRCLCGARECIGEVRGFAHLDANAKHARVARLAPHLRARVDAAS